MRKCAITPLRLGTFIQLCATLAMAADPISQFAADCYFSGNPRFSTFIVVALPGGSLRRYDGDYVLGRGHRDLLAEAQREHPDCRLLAAGELKWIDGRIVAANDTSGMGKEMSDKEGFRNDLSVLRRFSDVAGDAVITRWADGGPPHLMRPFDVPGADLRHDMANLFNELGLGAALLEGGVPSNLRTENCQRAARLAMELIVRLNARNIDADLRERFANAFPALQLVANGVPIEPPQAAIVRRVLTPLIRVAHTTTGEIHSVEAN